MKLGLYSKRRQEQATDDKRSRFNHQPAYVLSAVQPQGLAKARLKDKGVSALACSEQTSQGVMGGHRSFDCAMVRTAKAKSEAPVFVNGVPSVTGRGVG